MTKSKKYVLSIAGFDPSGGAGILADIKTFEACGVYGLGVCTSLTYQNDISFEGVDWMNPQQIINQIKPLQKRFEIEIIKIGLIENLDILQEIVTYLKTSMPDCKIIWDPILKASAGFDFHKKIDHKHLEEILRNIYLLTPNWNEAVKLTNSDDALVAANLLSKYCNVYLKGGHSNEEKATDRLFVKESKEVREFQLERIAGAEKHGSGCVLSSAIAAHLALTGEIVASCNNAKQYIYKYLQSSNDLLGFHFMN